MQLDKPFAGQSLIRFDYDGEEMLADQHKWNVAPEQTPWKLDDAPFEQRKAELERWRQEQNARQEVS